jgi:hypothetical protein
MREPDEGSLWTAKGAIRLFQTFGDPENDVHGVEIEEERRRGVFICDGLSDLSELDGEFPPTIPPQSLYDFFATTTNWDFRGALLVLEGMDEEEEAIFIAQAYREAALGLMDNPVYRSMRTQRRTPQGSDP